MNKTLSITGGRIIDAVANLDQITDLHIADGCVVAIGEAPTDFIADRHIDAAGLIVCAGFVDLSARLREPGETHKASIHSETYAAAANGITHLVCPPDTKPIVDTPAVAELLQQRASFSGFCHVLPIAALTQDLKGTHLAEMGALKTAGCIAVSNALNPIQNTEVLRNAFNYASSCDLTVVIQAADPWLQRGACVHEGAISTRLGLAGLAVEAETIGLARDLLLVEKTGVRAHFGRLSCAASVEMIRAAKVKGLAVSADVSAHQLFLTDMDILEYDSACHVYPPLRSYADQQALRAGLVDGTIDAICSDHQPHEPDAKTQPFPSTASGISALDTLLPLSLRLVDELSVPLAQALAWISSQPAQALQLDGGRIQIGKAANLCVFDATHQALVSPESMHSLRHNTPFLGWYLAGKVHYTVLNGRCVFET